MEKKTDTKKLLLAAFDKTKIIAEACKIAGVSPSGFYFNFYKDGDFRRQVLEKRAETLAEQIAEAGTV
jgi:ACT domain-containing protein